MNILIFGDIVGKPGRRGVAEVLPKWREQYHPDLVLANVENLAHGKGVTPKTLAEMDALGIDVYTSGNHVLDQRELSKQCFAERRNLIRPANYMGGWPGQGWVRISKELVNAGMSNLIPSPSVGRVREGGDIGKRVINTSPPPSLPPQGGGIGEEPSSVSFLIINLNGKVFFDEAKFGGIKNPFWAADEILNGVAKKDDIILVDFHAEATSEKAALGLHLDGRVNFFYGTHSHVPTADLRVLPKGTGFVTDIGMTGPLLSVIGADPKIALESYLDPQKKFKMEVPEEGAVVVRAVLVEMDREWRIIKLERLEKMVG